MLTVVGSAAADAIYKSCRLPAAADRSGAINLGATGGLSTPARSAPPTYALIPLPSTCFLRSCIASSLLLILLAGCAASTAVSAGRNTALDGMNLIEMTDDMSRQIIASPSVHSAIQQEGSLRVVVQPVENRMVAEVLPRGAAEAFTGRIRALLSQHAPDRFTWIMNRDDFYRLRQRERDLDFALGPSPDAIQPEYALTARFSSVADETSKRRTSYYLCLYELTNIQNRQVLWTGRYEVKKTAVKGFLD